MVGFRVHCIGSSHAVRIARSLAQSPGFGEEFSVDSTCAQSGKVFKDINWPDFSKYDKEDVLIIIPFGNDIFQRNSIKIERLKKGKIIHLVKSAPTSDEHLASLCESLNEKLKGTKAEVIIVTSFFRHLFCCADLRKINPKAESYKHNHPGLLGIQERKNRFILSFFKGSGYLVCRQESLLFDTFSEIRRVPKVEYRKKQPDSVHFNDKVYLDIVNKLLEQARALLTCLGL
jgi:hypothetical protein